MLRKNHGYAFLLFTFLVSAFFIPAALQAACSPYHERATINEIHDQGVVEYFIEVKPLDNTIPASIYNNWTVTICNDSGTCVGPLPLSLANQNNYPWLVIGKESVSDPDDPIGDPNLIDVNQGMDVILQDGNGDTIDYVTLNGYTAQQDASCTPAYDWQVTITQSNTNTVQRIPDGTGTWTGAPGGSTPPSDTTTNDPLPDGSTPPSLSLSHVIVSSGQTANFILTLEADAAYDITVDFQTLDDTALAGTHYTATSGTITIPAGTTAGYTVTIPVATLLPAPANDVGFYLFLDNPVNAALPSQFAIGTITSSVLILDTRLDECSWAPASLDVIDSSGNNQHGTAVNGPIPVDISEESGGICMGAAFDGTNYIEIADNALLDITANLTVMAWIKPGSIPNSGLKTIISKDENFEFHIENSGLGDGSGRIYWWWNDPSGTAHTLRSTTTFSANTWLHVTIRFQSGTASILINGQTDNTGTGFPASLRTNNDPLQIGADQGFAGREFDGHIDEILVFASAVSNSMVNIIYTNQLAKKNFDGSSRTCTACGPPADTFVLSTEGNAELVSPSLTFDNNDAVEYSASTSTATLLHDIGALFSSGANLVNALHLHPDGHVYFSLSEDSTTTASYGSQSYDSDDILDYDPVNDTLTLLFDGDSHFSANDENIDALYIDDADDLYISTTGGATIGGQGMNDEDVVRYTVVTSTASLYFDGSTHFSNNEDVDGFHIIDANTVLLSTTGNATLGAFFWWGGLTFTDGDVVKYDTATNTPTLFFDETTEFVDNEEIDAISIRPPLAPVVDHYIISHAGTGITCEAELVTISAHDANHVPVSPGTTITISTSPAGDSWALQSGTPANFSNLGSGQAEYTFAAGETSVSLWLTRLTAAIIDIDITDGTGITEASGTVLPGNDPSLEFRDTGFRFYAGGVANTIGTQIAGKESNIIPGSQTLTIRAVQTNTDTGACEGRLSGPQTIEMAFECIDPTTCQAASDVNITGINLLGAPIGTSPIAGNPLAGVATYSNVDLEFNASGIATFTINYEDAGQIALHAKEDIAAVPPDPAITLLGNSNTFTVRPFGFQIIVPGNSGATTASGGVFTQAGANFTINVTAMAWQAADDLDNDGIPDGHNDIDPSNNADLSDNTDTPNFGLEVTPETVTLSALLDQPAGGTDPGLTGTTLVNTFAAGTGFTNASRYDEVGIIEIAAAITDGDYLGIGAASTNDITSKSGYVGRFTPNNFIVNITPSPPTFDDACVLGAYSYLGEPFPFTTNPVVTITSFNAATPPAITQNYDCGGFWKFTSPMDLTYSYTDSSGNALAITPATNTVNPLAADITDCNGLVPLTLTDTITYARPTIATPINPFAASVDLAIAKDQLTDSDTICFNTGAGCQNFNQNGMTGANLLHGKIQVFNNFGPENQDITDSPFEAQFFNGTSWVVNANDACSTSLVFCSSPTAGRVNTIFPDPLTGGLGTFTVTTSGTSGEVLDVCLTSPLWLSETTCAAPDSTCGEFTFGIYRGNDRIINWREIVR